MLDRKNIYDNVKGENKGLDFDQCVAFCQKKKTRARLDKPTNPKLPWWWWGFIICILIYKLLWYVCFFPYSLACIFVMLLYYLIYK